VGKEGKMLDPSPENLAPPLSHTLLFTTGSVCVKMDVRMRLNSDLTLEPHIAKVTRMCYYHVRPNSAVDTRCHSGIYGNKKVSFRLTYLGPVG
jgi:hypothetical protein